MTVVGKEAERKMISPFEGKFKLTSTRGYRDLFEMKEYHKGIDLVGVESTEVHAVADGKCFVLYEPNGFGNYVRQLLPDGRRIYYAHLKTAVIKSGAQVKTGQVIGIMGATGRVTGAHTHLELRPAGTGGTSLDISAFTGIPNAVGEYIFRNGAGGENNGNGGNSINGNQNQSNRKSYDDTVEMLLNDGIISDENMVNWELMLSGKAPIKEEYVRKLLERYHSKIAG